MKPIKVVSPLPNAVAWLISSVLLFLNLFMLLHRTAPTPATGSTTVPAPVSAAVPVSVRSVPSIPHGTVHPLLHAQNLSHAALHSKMRLHLAAIFRPRAVGVVGVADAVDVREFAAAGYRVHAVEPGVDYVRSLRAEAARHPDWRIDVHGFAAADRSDGATTVEYLSQTVAKSVPTRRLDDLLTDRHEQLAVLSVDVQGHEPGVLRGATALLPHRVHSLWVEAAACHPSLPQVLRLLDEHYAIFDFVPRGPPRGAPKRSQNFRHMWEPDRPGEFAAFERWMCRRNRAEFNWAQLDFLAVRRDLLPNVWDDLSNLAQNYCGRQGIFCDIVRSF